jgi:hypothetical protein
MWNEYAKNPENALEWQTQYLRFMFDLEDASGDGSIDVDEFISVCSCYGLEPSECKEAFQKMSCVSVSTIRCRLNVSIESFSGQERSQLRTIRGTLEAVLHLRESI